MEPGDLIDFETIIETPQQEEKTQQECKKVPRLINFELQEFINREIENYIEERRPIFYRGMMYYHCEWLKIGKKERCGKLCKQFYCSAHSKYISKGGVIPLHCLCCGVGVRRNNQLCTRCEEKYEVEYK